ncbi:MAG: MBOAT family protein [Gammaproteobacteria bacterium]|nr:MBOAT family protein [Gammaproteobacteria bacterium]
MLFNSYSFIFLFLPITLSVFFLTARIGREAAITWLVLASLFFYGWWNSIYLILIMISMFVNFYIGNVISSNYKENKIKKSKIYLLLGLFFNLGILAYYKYAGFIVYNINAFSADQISITEIVLPLAISFFTFQQVAYLVDASRGIAQEYRFSHYALFVTFFPQLIAGPIVHHKEMLPQFMQSETLKPQFENIAIGLTIFFIGLCKKVVFADGAAQYSSPIFEAASTGSTLTFLEAWGGVLAYTMQLYFDFSGYSDMAIGAARLFGIRLPLNFFSPYKSTSIIEFWRRWHITLSRFLRDYLYFSMGGNRRGKLRRYVNLFTTMLLGGLWHGAGWTFVVWGALHGFYLVVNHAWHRFRDVSGVSGSRCPKISKFVAWLVTFLSVVIGWVFFRASDFDSAIAILKGMAGINGLAIPNGILARLGEAGVWLQGIGVGTSLGGGSTLILTYLWIMVLLFVTLVLPNTQQIMSKFSPVLSEYKSDPIYSISIGRNFEMILLWRPTVMWSMIIAMIATLGVLALTSVSEFLYFQF